MLAWLALLVPDPVPTDAFVYLMLSLGPFGLLLVIYWFVKDRASRKGQGY